MSNPEVCKTLFERMIDFGVRVWEVYLLDIFPYERHWPRILEGEMHKTKVSNWFQQCVNVCTLWHHFVGTYADKIGDE